MRKISGKLIFQLGLLLLSTALILGEWGLPHGIKLALLIVACILELLGMTRQCREKEET